MSKSRIFSWLLILSLLVAAQADEQRAPAPQFTPEQTRGVFFDDLDSAIRGTRPTLSSVRKVIPAVSAAASETAAAGPTGDGSWAGLISGQSLEDEIKRLKLAFDATVTTPGAFNGGGYQEARIQLTALASLFAVITEHTGEVRWKDQAGAARDLIARSAFNCKAGSNQVYNEAKLRKGDLQDIVAGTGLANKDAEPKNDWTAIADRVPLMTYAESVLETLGGESRDAGSVASNTDSIKRGAELLAVIGEIFTKEGMDDADDEDYVKLSHAMKAEASNLAKALERGNAEEVVKGASMIRKRCDTCHEQYR
jgi:Cytochrome C'